jgi:hypothetical protein
MGVTWRLNQDIGCGMSSVVRLRLRLQKFLGRRRSHRLLGRLTFSGLLVMALFVVSLLSFISLEHAGKPRLAPCNSNKGYHHCLRTPIGQLAGFSLAGAEDTNIEFSSACTFHKPLACVASIASRSWKVECRESHEEAKLSDLVRTKAAPLPSSSPPAFGESMDLGNQGWPLKPGASWRRSGVAWKSPLVRTCSMQWRIYSVARALGGARLFARHVPSTFRLRYTGIR